MENITPTVERFGNAVKAAMAAVKPVRESVGNLPRSTSVGMLIALNRTGKHLYAGTVPDAVIERRRAANRRARQARKVSRGRNFRKGVR